MGKIYDRMRFKGRSLPAGHQTFHKPQVIQYGKNTPDPSKKGVWQGNCNITSCQKPGAVWWNIYMRKYYCTDCATKINYRPDEIICVPGTGNE